MSTYSFHKTDLGKPGLIMVMKDGVPVDDMDLDDLLVELNDTFTAASIAEAVEYAVNMRNQRRQP